MEPGDEATWHSRRNHEDPVVVRCRSMVKLASTTQTTQIYDRAIGSESKYKHAEPLMAHGSQQRYLWSQLEMVGTWWTIQTVLVAMSIKVLVCDRLILPIVHD